MGDRFGADASGALDAMANVAQYEEWLLSVRRRTADAFRLAQEAIETAEANIAEAREIPAIPDWQGRLATHYVEDTAAFWGQVDSRWVTPMRETAVACRQAANRIEGV